VTAPACVTGRFQPVHEDHLRLFRMAVEGRSRLIVGITTPDPSSRRPEPESPHRHRDDANPFTYWERCELLLAALGHDPRVLIVPFDLGRPELWEGYAPLDAVQYVGRGGPWEAEKTRRLAAGGYRVVEAEPGPGPRRSATAIRAALRAGAGWEALVPPATVAPLRRMLARRRAAGVAL
jgi:nicotinamide mononucleotide adenylyltransferase